MLILVNKCLLLTDVLHMELGVLGDTAEASINHIGDVKFIFIGPPQTVPRHSSSYLVGREMTRN